MIKSDVLFLDIYRSIRGDWSGGILNRGKVMLKLLPHTSLSEELKNWFESHLNSMIVSWNKNKEHFDGRDWSRDVTHSYDDLTENKEWFDEKFYHENTIYGKADSEFTDKFPIFSAKNYMINHLLPQLRGQDTDIKAMDSHSEAEIKITLENINLFLGFYLKMTTDEENGGELKTLDSLKPINKDRHQGSCHYCGGKMFCLNCDLKESAIKLIKEVRKCLSKYSEGSDEISQEQSGSFWQTEEGKKYKEFEKLGIIIYDDEGAYISDKILLFFLNISEEDLKI